MKLCFRNVVLIMLTLVTLLALPAHAARGKKDVPNPDFTAGDAIPSEAKQDWNLGPTGLRGWMFRRGLTTTDARQIRITEVAKGSPADGVLAVGDVILGVGPGARFESDVRKALAAAITEAEKPDNGGKLVLNVWRGGTTREAVLHLRTMGTFSATSPVRCQKTEQIIQQACEYLQANGLGRGISGQLDALGLLATGDKKYLPLVRDYVRQFAKPGLSLDFSDGMKAWHWGYTNLLLTEYYLATGDESVLPTIREYTTKIAMGQSLAGTWGHGMAPPIQDGDGFRHGILGGYGALNSAGLVCAISLVLGRECGVKSPVVDGAIDKSAAFFRFYVDKGSVPYGDHAPWMRHASNGKTAAAAVLMDLLGDAEAASFFTRMAVASYDDLESGHTGHFFSFLWSGLAATAAGDEASAALMKEIRWFYELERRWTGQSVYQPQLMGDNLKYGNWSSTGARLLHHCGPRQQLHITGKKGRAAKPLAGDALRETIAAGRDGLTKDKSAGELLAMLRSWSPIVRMEAAEALGKTDDNVVGDLIAMLQGGDRYARYGACEGLRCAGRKSAEAAQVLIDKGLNSDDPTLRYHAVYAFSSKGMNSVGHLALPTMLKLAVKLDPADPLQLHLATVLFYSGSVQPIQSICSSKQQLDQVDRKLLIEAVRAMLRTNNGRGRTLTAQAVYPHLTTAELNELWGDIYIAAAERAPSGVMFADGVRVDSVELMAKHRIKEGVDAGARLVAEDRWGSYNRITRGVPVVAGYGGAVRDVLPMMKQMIEKRYAKDPTSREKYLAILEKAASEEKPPLTSIAPQIEKARQSNRSR
jgi:hypothetical protein